MLRAHLRRLAFCLLLILAGLGMAGIAHADTEPPPVPTEAPVPIPLEEALPVQVEPLYLPGLPTAAAPAVMTLPPPSSQAGLLPMERVIRNLTYCRMDGVALKLDLHYPSQDAERYPLVLYVHGGGWQFGNKTEVPRLGFDFLLQQDFIVASINYRLAPDHLFPAQIEDVKCAVRFLRHSAQRYRIDPDHIGAWGSSAGGHLVSLLGTTDAQAGWDVGPYLDHSSRVQAVADFFGPIDLVEFLKEDPETAEKVFGTTPETFERVLSTGSPTSYIGAEDAPFLIVHGEDDRSVPLLQSINFYFALQAAGVPVKLIVVQNAGHGLAPSSRQPIRPSLATLRVVMVEFFKKHLR